MRTVLLVLCSACTANVAAPEVPPDSVRDHLRADTHLLVSPHDSAGVITAERRASDGWQTGIVDLDVESGELVASVDTAGTVTLGQLQIALGPIAIPETVIGHAAQLTQVRIDATMPAQAETTWVSDDEGHATAQLDLALSWSLEVDGSTSPLGTPDLPPVPGTLALTGDGTHVHAELRLHAPGELWSWASLIKLEDLELVLGASY